MGVKAKVGVQGCVDPLVWWSRWCKGCGVQFAALLVDISDTMLGAIGALFDRTVVKSDDDNDDDNHNRKIMTAQAHFDEVKGVKI